MDLCKVALVTGAARGLGKSIALTLATQGYAVALNYAHSAQAVQQVRDDIKAMGQKAMIYQADVSDFEQAQTLIRQTIEQLGGLDVLVNNAGITRDGPLVRMKEESFDDVIRINLKSAFNCSRFAAAHMMRKRSGAIINIASVAGVLGNAGQANYSASKAGVIGLTKSMARELAARGVRVNAVAPGLIQTDMTDSMPEAARQPIEQGIPLGRIGQPQDVAQAVAFLAQASYITGQVLCVDGGMAI